MNEPHWAFPFYLLGQRVRILGAVLVRDAVAPWATPVVEWISRSLMGIGIALFSLGLICLLASGFMGTGAGPLLLMSIWLVASGVGASWLASRG